MIKKNKCVLFIIIGLVMIVSILFVFFNNYNDFDNSISLEKVKLKEKLIMDDKNIAILVEKEDGSGYEESETFPVDMFLNMDLSNCIDINGQIINQSLTYENGIIYVDVQSTAYCYLYFEYNSIPNPFTFYVGGSDNPEYVISIDTTVYLSWEDINITHYCVTNIEGSSNCEWQSVSGNSITGSHILTSGDGTKTVYAYIKNIKNGISEVVSDTIYLDTQKPINNSITINSGTTYTTSTDVTLSLTSGGVTEMCISNTSSCSNWETFSKSKSWTLTTGDGTKTVYVWFRDAAGNTTSYVSDTITLDTTAPTVTVSASSTKISITSSEAGTYCVNTTSTATDFSNCTLTGSISANTSLTTSALSTSGTYYVHIKDSAGNVGGSSGVKITIIYSFGQYLIDNSISGLNKSYIGEDTLYRFSGTSGNTGIYNYICLGTTSKCSSGSSYMYRIIGVEPSTGYVKVIKQTTYSSGAMNSSSWTSSDVYSTVNTYYSGLGFKDMIQEYKWNVYWVSSSSTREDIINAENDSTSSGYFGILSLSDYYLAYSGDQNWNTTYSNYTKNWIHIYNNGTNADEWTMTEHSTYIWRVRSTGSPIGSITSRSYAFRPTFYLKATVVRSSGSGTSSDPFLVSLAG